ncbi:MAG: glycosyltransferase [Planctomycetales bacterium]|nr:glycosyltransferase [Planctomycetales bacterium]
MTDKSTVDVLHVASSICSLDVDHVINSAQQAVTNTVCLIDAITPLRRRLSATEVITAVDNVPRLTSELLNSHLEQLGVKHQHDQETKRKRLADHGLEVMSAERRHRFDVNAALRLRKILRGRSHSTVRVYDKDARQWVRLASRKDHLVCETAQLSSKIRFDRPHNFDRKQFCESLNLPSNAILIGAVGPLQPWRGIKDLIWAAELLRVINDRTYLLIAGTGPQEWRLHRFRDQVGVGKRVRFLGNHSEHPCWLSLLDYFWAGAKRESSTSSLVEAISLQVPVVATDISEHRRLITSEASGFLVKPGDRAAFARHTWRMINAPGLAAQIGQAGRSAVQSNLSPDTV